MDRITATILARSVELLPILLLWQAYGSAGSTIELVSLFVSRDELHQIGTLTCLAIVGRTAAMSVRDTVYRLGNFAVKIWRAITFKSLPPTQ